MATNPDRPGVPLPLVAVIAVVALLIGVAVGSWSGSDDNEQEDAGVTTPPSSSTSTSTSNATSTSTTAAPTTEPTAPLPTGDEVADGRHATYLTGIDVPARSLSVDVIQWLSGDEAVAAYREDNPDNPDDGPSNDYYIVNDNTRVRTVEVADDVDVQLVRLAENTGADLDPGTFEELPGYLEDYKPPDDPRLSYNPFWITVTAGEITAIEEQYVP